MCEGQVCDVGAYGHANFLSGAKPIQCGFRLFLAIAAANKKKKVLNTLHKLKYTLDFR